MLDLQTLPKSTVVYVHLDDHLIPHCGVCKARNGLLRLHPVSIHYDAESPDFLDDLVMWGSIHSEELYSNA